MPDEGMAPSTGHTGARVPSRSGGGLLLFSRSGLSARHDRRDGKGDNDGRRRFRFGGDNTRGDGGDDDDDDDNDDSDSDEYRRGRTLRSGRGRKNSNDDSDDDDESEDGDDRTGRGRSGRGRGRGNRRIGSGSGRGRDGSSGDNNFRSTSSVFVTPSSPPTTTPISAPEPHCAGNDRCVQHIRPRRNCFSVCCSHNSGSWGRCASLPATLPSLTRIAG